MLTQTSLCNAATLAALTAAAVFTTGCGLNGGPGITKTPAAPIVGQITVTGSVHGGQQPVAGATIRVYAASAAGYGAAAVPLLNSGVTVLSSSDGMGSFSVTGQYTCTSPEQRVYLTATGGNSGSGNNPALAMMAALGRCGDLSGSTQVSLNEVTTVGSVWALAPFMSGPAGMGAPASNTVGLQNAFSDVPTLVNIAGGAAPGINLPAGTVMPVRTIYTLADILAACINSNGSGAPCTSLFTASTVNGAAPADTLTAALNIAQHPAQNVSALFQQIPAGSPFQPTLTEAPGDFTLASTFAPGLTTPSSVAADAAGNVWLTDSAANKVVRLAHTGAVLSTATGLNAPSAIAVDQNGTGWVANKGNSSVAAVTAAGAVSTYTGGGLAAPSSVSLDGQGNVWLTNPGNGTVSAFTNAGVALSGSGFASPAGGAVAVGANPK